MKKIKVTPENIRAHGNILNKNKDVAMSNGFSENMFIENKVIDGVEYRVHRLNYMNNQLYFSSYHPRTTVNTPETITGVVKDEAGEAIPNATVALLRDNVIVDVAVSNNDGIVCFEEVYFSIGTHEIQLSYNNIKSGKAIVTCFNPSNITIEPVWVVKGRETVIKALVKEGSTIISNIPVKLTANGTTVTEYTDDNGVASFNYVGTGLDSTVTLICGFLNKSFDINDSLLYIHDGAIETQLNTKMVNLAWVTGAVAELSWLNDGFHITPQSDPSVASGDPVKSRYLINFGDYDEANDYVSTYGNKFHNVSVEFVYKGGEGINPLDFRVWESVDAGLDDNIFSIKGTHLFDGYQITTNKGINRILDESLAIGDKIKLIFFEDTVLIYRNNVLLTTDTIIKYDSLVFGFHVDENQTSIYEDFKICELPSSYDQPVPDSITLVLDKNNVSLNENVTLAATVKTNEDNPVIGEQISFYNAETLLGTSVTNANGVATLNTSFSLVGTYNNIVAKSNNDKTSNAVSIKVKNNNHPSTITLSLSKNQLSPNEQFTATATVVDGDGDPVENQRVMFKIGNQAFAQDNLITNSEGIITFTHSITDVGETNCTAMVSSIRGDIFSYDISSQTIRIFVVNDIAIDAIEAGFLIAGGLNSNRPHFHQDDVAEQNLCFKLLKDGAPAIGVSASILLDNVTHNVISDTNGCAILKYKGTCKGNVPVVVSSGEVSETFNINDVEFAICNNKYYGSHNAILPAINTNYKGYCNMEYVSEGFKLSSEIPYENSSHLFGYYNDVIVEFTYKESVGHFPVQFMIVEWVQGTSNYNVVAHFIYQKALGKYGLYSMNNGSYAVTYTDELPLNKNDKFKVELDGNLVKIYRNGSLLIQGTPRNYNSNGKLMYGFPIAANQNTTYDKFMIKPK